MRIVVGQLLPDLAGIATNPGEFEWVAHLPFKYDQLGPVKVIGFLVKYAKRPFLGLFGGRLVLKMLADGQQRYPVTFDITRGSSADGELQLEIARRS